ncbi:MAG TPA: DsrE family protein [Mycobacteriales bacterium]|nr:DsrE family protein [Mycobacteriales bacterium]
MRTGLVVKVTAGEDAPERCAQAFTVSSVAALSGVRVSLWLTGEAVWMAVPGRAEAFVLPHSAPLAGLRDDVLEHGTLTVCTQCAARRDLTADELLVGVRLAGAATFVVEALEDDVQALVY